MEQVVEVPVVQREVEVVERRVEVPVFRDRVVQVPVEVAVEVPRVVLQRVEVPVVEQRVVTVEKRVEVPPGGVVPGVGLHWSRKCIVLYVVK